MNNNSAVLAAGKISAIATCCLWLLPVSVHSQSTRSASATKGGIVIGRDVVQSNIRVTVNNGFTIQDIERIIRNAVKPFNNANILQKKEIDQLSSALGEKSSILRAFSKAIGGEYKSDSDFIIDFFDFVNRYNELDQKNREFQSGDELDKAVQIALSEGDLEKAQTLQLAKKYVFDQRSLINHKYSFNSIEFTDGWDSNISIVKIPKISNTAIEKSDILLFKGAHEKFQAALTELNKDDLINDIKSIVAFKNKTSLFKVIFNDDTGVGAHQLGIAIDINMGDFCFITKKKCLQKITAIAIIMEKNGFIWAGRQNRQYSKHFQLSNFSGQ